MPKGIHLERKGLGFKLSTRAFVCRYPMPIVTQISAIFAPSFTVGTTESKKRKCFSQGWTVSLRRKRVNRMSPTSQPMYGLLTRQFLGGEDVNK